MDYSKLLKEYNLKVTPQRLAIVEELYYKGHMNVDDLYSNLLKKFPSISLATIYKNINSMIEKIFLHEVKIPNQKSVYELSKDEHSHVICKACNCIVDINLDTRLLVKEASNATKFDLDESSVIFSGLCKSCSK